MATLVAAAACAAAWAGEARELRADRAVPRSCEARPFPAHAPGVARVGWRAPADGLLTAKLEGGLAPDWDLAAFRRGERGAVAASTSFASAEQLGLWVRRGERLIVQACRRSGGRASIPLGLSLFKAPVGPASGPATSERTAPTDQRGSLESVAVSRPADVERLERLGLDVTDDVSSETATVALYSDAQRSLLGSLGYSTTTLVADLAARDRAERRAEERAVSVRTASALPTGRQTYRVYEDYTSEMKNLAEQNPGLVRPVVIGTSFEGRPIEGIEIASQVNRRDDGRPAYLQMGLHHAREWPSGEFPMEFAHQLVSGYGATPRITALLDSVRVFVFPVINVDGFIASRSFGTSPADDDPIATLPLAFNDQAAYKRKNCRPTVPGSGSVPCALRTNSGVDLNRNYGYYWGGPGSDGNVTSQSYRGTGPFSEPESEAVHRFSAHLQPTVFITGHTFTDDGKWLRQPGFDGAQLPQNGSGHAITPDEAAMKGLGDDMAAATGWSSELGYETLGDITGATEDWNYFAQGTYGYTPEARGSNFHGKYADSVVSEYVGDSSHAGFGVREAFLIAGERAADQAEHSVIEGAAPPGATLRLHKEFDSPTSQPGLSVHDVLDTTLRVPKSGSYEWQVNPSSRPLVPGETWTMTCARQGQGVFGPVEVAVDRGDQASVDWSSSCGTVSGNLPPLADFGFSPSAPLAGQQVTFSSSASDSDGTIAPADQRWDLDHDGQFDDATGASATRTFSALGAYDASLEVTDDGGAKDVRTRTVVVGKAPTGAAAPRCHGKRATIFGTLGDDHGAGALRGTARRDVIVALAGDDEVLAGRGRDLVCGNSGDDSLSGGAGRDRLIGGPGADELRGGPKRDRCSGGPGRDQLFGCP